jgi:hypothetical protein
VSPDFSCGSELSLGKAPSSRFVIEVVAAQLDWHHTNLVPISQFGSKMVKKT